MRGLFGFIVLYAMVFAADCLPGMSKHPQQPTRVFGDADVPACVPEAVPALLCNAVTKTSPAHECAICPDPSRHCFTSTSVYCATSCDEPLCERRQ
jgi:hypothetical protein